MTKWIVILLACLGIAAAAYTAATQKEQIPNPVPARPPSVNPFERGLAASGLVEASSRNIEVAAPEPGMVAAVFVTVGDRVDAGDPLFQLDTRTLDAEIIRGEAALDSANQALVRLQSMPRAETLPPMVARLEEAEALTQDMRSQLERMEQVGDKRAITEEDLTRRRFAVGIAAARAAAAQAELDLVRAGAWEADLNVARAAVRAAEADLRAWRLRLERLTVRAPVAGTILKRDVEPGEHAATGGGAPAPIALGDLTRLHVRAQVNEEDAPLLRENARGAARVRSPSRIELPLVMLRIEPLARPKRQLTGDFSELVDTRVVEVVFEVDTAQMPSGSRLFPGQIVDVFIETPAPE